MQEAPTYQRDKIYIKEEKHKNMSNYEGLSKYEIMRLENIKRNKAVMENLGLSNKRNTKRPVLKPQKKKTKLASSKRKQRPLRPTRSSKRLKHVPVKNYKEDVLLVDYDLDYVVSSDSGSDSDYSDESIPQPVRFKAKKRTGSRRNRGDDSKVGSIPINSFLQVEKTDLIVYEDAKTSRSKCRKCMQQLQKGEKRVGMKAWIMGRNSVTWQHPICFLNNIKVGNATNSRTKCKYSNVLFHSGDLRVGLRSHTATSWVTVESAMKLLQQMRNIVAKITVENLEGFSTLSCEEDQNRIRSLFDTLSKQEEMQPSGATNNGSGRKAKRAKKIMKTKNAAKNENNGQPKLGEKTMSKDNVAWRFGGHLCFGVLIATRETKTHCYARTHKGNIKTLTKGKDYWWMK